MLLVVGSARVHTRARGGRARADDSGPCRWAWTGDFHRAPGWQHQPHRWASIESHRAGCWALGTQDHGHAANAEPHPAAARVGSLRIRSSHRLGHLVLHLPTAAGAAGPTPSRLGNACCATASCQQADSGALPAWLAGWPHTDICFASAVQALKRKAGRVKQHQTEATPAAEPPAKE